jgi:transglutaminase-like putative cysteine protease
MTVLRVRHVTTYSYANPVRFGVHRVMYRPRDSHDQRLLHAELAVTPQPSAVNWVHDVFGNSIALVGFSPDDAATELRFESSIVLDHDSLSGPPVELDPTARLWPFDYPQDFAPDLAPYLRRETPTPEVDAWARRFGNVDAGEVETGRLLMTLNAAFRESLSYRRRTEPGTQPPALTLKLAGGTCRDFAALMIDACRALGFAARFVSGYVYSPGRDTAERRGGGATHAWVQVFLPGAGWVEFDPTNAIVGSRDLIRVGVAREPRQARPLSGSFSGTAADYLGMSVDVEVRREPADAAHNVRLPSAVALEDAAT